MTQIPGPKRNSPMGILPAFQRDPLGLMMGLHRDYGRIVQAPGLFAMRIVSITAPEMVQEVLVNQSDKLVKPAPLKQIFRSSFGNGLFFSEGTFWKRQRKLVQPAFHHGRLGVYSERIVNHTAAMLDTWRGQDVIALRKQMNSLTLKIVMDAIFHADIQAETETIYQAMMSLGEAIGKQSANPLLAMLLDSFPLPVLRRKQQASKRLHTTIDRLIQQRRAAGEESDNLLSSLIFTCDAETGEAMLDQQVRDEVMTLFIAGHETSSAIMTAIFGVLEQAELLASSWASI
jgi:cytochrome P450